MTEYIAKFKDFSNAYPCAGADWDKDCAGYVYVIGFDEPGIVKIGSAASPLVRLAQLQCGNPFELQLRAAVGIYDADPSLIEFATHRLVSAHLIRGEWFELEVDEALGAIIKAARNKKVRFGSAQDAYQKAFPPMGFHEDERRRLLRIKLGMEA